MKTFIAIIAYALSLFGIDVGSHTRIDHVSSNGTDVLYSKIVSQQTSTRFECVRSASGHCYYTVYGGDCAAGVAKAASVCVPTAVAHFSLAGGESRQVAALPLSRLCVGMQAPVAGCE